MLTSFYAKLAGLALIAVIIGGLYLDNSLLRADARADVAQLQANTKQCQLDAVTAANKDNAAVKRAVAAQEAADSLAYAGLTDKRSTLSAGLVSADTAIRTNSAKSDPLTGAAALAYRDTLESGK